MKTSINFLLIAFFAFALSACNKGKIEQLEAQNAELRQVTTLQDSLLNDFMTYFNAFDENLQAIKEREQVITMNASDPEFQGDRKAKILDDIEVINSLLVQNRSIIDSLSNRLENSEGRLGQFRRTIASLNSRLEERQVEVDEMKSQLETMNFTIAELNTKVDTLSRARRELTATTLAQASRIEEQTARIDEQSEKIAFQTDALNTAYYTVGTARELRDANILEREGGVIGIGQSNTLREDFDPTGFQRVDITQMQMIPVNARKVELMTTHPTGSYILHEDEAGKGITQLEITDPNRFWSASKVLVVVTN